MNPSQTNSYNINLYEKDQFVPTKGVAGQLTANSSELVFSSPNHSPITIPISSIAVADFTNIFAKTQFILSLTDGKQYIFGFAQARSVGKSILKGARPFNGVQGLSDAVDNAAMAHQCKDYLITILPTRVVKTRKEVRIINILLGTILSIIVIAVILFAIISLIIAE